MPLSSVIIPTLERGDCLRDCLESLWAQTDQDFEIIKVTEEGPLAEIRNEGAKRARGRYVIFIDDDVVCAPNWHESIVRGFLHDARVAGVSGPSVILSEYRRNRDLFRIPPLKWLYDLAFLGSQRRLPGHFTKAGAWTTGACDEKCSYEGEVEYLEACNMAFRRDVFWCAGGFDTKFKGIGDWSEPDLAFRIRRAGYKLWFSRDARLEHRPSKSGAFKKRARDAANRLENYLLFSSRHIKPCWQNSLYKQFMRVYYDLTAAK